jgi:hypothetical protein
MAIKREKIQPKGIHVRMMAGQPAYTQVVAVSGTGRQIFVAGQLARDADGNCVGKGDMRAQIMATVPSARSPIISKSLTRWRSAMPKERKSCRTSTR